MKLAITAMIGGKAVIGWVDLPTIEWRPQNQADPPPAPGTCPQAILRVDIGDEDHMVTFR